jgi:hypothetical protein
MKEIPVTPAPYTLDLALIGHFNSLSKRIRNGPHYTVTGINSRIAKSASGTRSNVTAVGRQRSSMGSSFGALQTWSHMQKKPERALPKLFAMSYGKTIQS